MTKGAPSTLETYSDIIAGMAERRAEEERIRLDDMEQKLPSEIARLTAHSHERLLTLYEQFMGGRMSPRETVLRQQFFDAIKAELLLRLKSASREQSS